MGGTAWSSMSIPSQAGKTFVITGANCGIGFETARVLAHKGAYVVCACRDPSKGRAAVNRINEEISSQRLGNSSSSTANNNNSDEEQVELRGCAAFEEVNLASLASIQQFATRMKEQAELARATSINQSSCSDKSCARFYGCIDGLLHNAGIFTASSSEVTTDGFELHMGVNYFSRFALTAHLFPLLRNTRSPPRVVVTSHIFAEEGVVDVDNLDGLDRNCDAREVIASSAMASLIFAKELGQRYSWLSVSACHCGMCRTEYYRHFPATYKLPFVLQEPGVGALAALRCLGDPNLMTNSYVVPSHLGFTKGPPVILPFPRRTSDPWLMQRVWEESQRLTGVSFPADRTSDVEGAAPCQTE